MEKSMNKIITPFMKIYINLLFIQKVKTEYKLPI